jgi:hypothetical protein
MLTSPLPSSLHLILLLFLFFLTSPFYTLSSLLSPHPLLLLTLHYSTI